MSVSLSFSATGCVVPFVFIYLIRVPALTAVPFEVKVQSVRFSSDDNVKTLSLSFLV